MIAVSLESKTAVMICFVNRLPTIMYQFPKFVAGRDPIQSLVITSHRPEMAIGRRGGFE